MVDMDTTGANKKLTRKQQAFVKGMLDNPKASATEIASRVYDVNNRNTARVIATENLAKPAIQSELAKHSEEIEELIARKTRELGNSDKLDAVKEGLLNARWMHDKVHGKATQKVVTENSSVSIVVSMK
jgi:hypothetical protein